MKQILVIGAGPAGMMAAIRAAENGAAVTLLEKMKRPGRKMMITGKGRCNITNAADVPEIIRNIHGNGAFLNSSMRAFDNQDVMEFFRQQGVPVKVERGNRVFPVSDKAQDVVDAMVHRLHELGVRIELEMPVADILLQEGRVAGVRTKSGAHYKADAVILAVGGASYPGTGSTGDGYEMARKLGHTVVPLRPSLVPLETEEEWGKDVQGLSLRNVRATLLAGGEKVQEMFGEMMFTHFGVTGPIILSMSRRAAKCLAEGKFVELELNLKPALTPEKLDARIQRDFEQHIRKSLKNGLLDLLRAGARLRLPRPGKAGASGHGGGAPPPCRDVAALDADHHEDAAARRGHRDGRRRLRAGNQPEDDGVKARAGALLRRRGRRCRCLHGRLQPAGGLLHGQCGRLLERLERRLMRY